jgi:F-type H+-transporting ATPase subunit b
MLNILAAPTLPVLAAAAIDIDATVLVQMVLFLITIFLLHNVLFKPYLRTLDARKEAVEGSREEAGELDARAAALMVEYDEKMMAARRDAKEVRDSLRNQGLAEQNDVIDEVRTELTAKLGDERNRIALQVEEAKKQIQSRSQGLAEAMVKKVIPGA